MSDDFACCNRCRAVDVAFLQVDKTIDINDDEQLVKCEECGAVIKQKDIYWMHVEYGGDRYDQDTSYAAKSYGI